MRVHCDLSGAGFFYTLGLYKVKLGLGLEIWAASGRQRPQSGENETVGNMSNCLCHWRSPWYEPHSLLPSADQEPAETGQMALRSPFEIPPKAVCAALFSPLILIARLCFWPRMIKAQALSGRWSLGQLGLATWQSPGSEKQWWWGPLCCWPSLWKPLRNHALQIKQVCPGASPLAWKGKFPKASLCKESSELRAYSVYESATM